MTGLDALLFCAWLLSLALCGLLIRRLRNPSLRKDPVLCTWELSLPRGSTLTPVELAAWFRGLAPRLAPDLPPPVLEFRGEGRRLQLFLTAPQDWEEDLRAQLSAWSPETRLQVREPEPDPSVRVELPLHLARAAVLPLPAPGSNHPDPLLPELGLLTSAEDRCGLALSWGPPPADWSWWAPSALDALRRGEPAPARGLWGRLTLLLERLSGRSLKRVSGKPALPPELAKEAEAKVQEPVFTADLRVWAAVDGRTGQPEARRRCTTLAAQLEVAFSSPVANRLVRGRLVERSAGGALRGLGADPLVLTATELARLFHLPPDHPLVPREPSRVVPAGAGLLPRLTGAGRTWLGEALTETGAVRFGLGAEERRLHTYVVGKTGTGKSTLLASLLRQDLEAGRGVGLIDPHGDLAEAVLARVPPSRADEVLYFNAADADFPVGFNLLAVSDPHRRPLVASGVIAVFKKLYGESWGPRLEYFLRNAVLALLELPHPSLLALPRLLTDRQFRARCLTYVRDPLLRTFFLQEFEGYDARWRSEALSPILNKVGQFLASPVVRHIVGQGGAGFDLRSLMDRSGIFVANLASGKIGEDNSAMLGGLLVAGFQLAAMSRADQPEAERRDFALCVDEFQHFANDAFAVILSEARKYRLSLVLAHQFLDQVPPHVSEAVFGNVGSLCVFRVGAGDTPRLARELAPTFDGQDLVHLPNHHFCGRVALPTGTAPPFSARTLPPSAGEGDLSALIQRSRARWARPRAEVELEIADLWEGRMD